jgi:hypothetical protein
MTSSEVVALLRERFEASVIWHLEGAEFRAEIDPAEWSASEIKDEEALSATIDALEKLIDTVDAIPQSLLSLAEELTTAAPQEFDDVLLGILPYVGRTFFPADAAEFVQELSDCVKRKRPTHSPAHLKLVCSDQPRA